eukprot:CAMPEP_0114460438 /NCGR_PEP_ID=MMETSP0104-20121206/5750_1 /TAXON_ID=37642 ORGANISM="Paraphysomonas imperforata, Strain PA2" /NCGR_SAMPLE_ID=MMETSP0104 /ASSEMBLY_ACC=CAM_ASM_000202 /LENGTH=222 /DNA_ID=CAMNT_0001633159 /DNA_START=3 /DNA_END=666 /DNA_ORIENTATION=+
MKFSGKTSSHGAVLSTDEDGMIRSSTSISVGEVEADGVTAKKITTQSVVLADVPSGSVLSVSDNGIVQQATDINVNSMKSSTVSVTGEGEFASVVLSTVKGATVLATDESGRVIPATEAALSSLTVANDAVVGTLTATSLAVPSLPAGFMSVNAKGDVSATSAIDVSSVSASALSITESAVLKGGLQLTSTGAGRHVDISVDSIVTSGTITAQGLTVDQLKL